MARDGHISVETEYECSECGHTEDEPDGFLNYGNQSDKGLNKPVKCPECGARLT